MLWIRSGFNADPDDQNLLILDIDPDPGRQTMRTHADLDLDPGQTSASQKGVHEKYIL
jgi:hypothetical protein